MDPAFVCLWVPHRQAKGNKIQTANLKLLDEGVTAREGEKVPLSVKELAFVGEGWTWGGGLAEAQTTSN